MKTSTKIIATGLLFGACSWASAGPVLTISSEGSAAAIAAEQVFKTSLQAGNDTEDFEDFGDLTGVDNSSDQSATIGSAGIAEFTSVTAGSGGACDNGGYSCNGGLAVLNDSVSPFNGRFSIPEGESSNWLDSMDAREMSISVATGNNALGFFMTDPNDSGGRFDIGGIGFDFEDVFGSSLGNGKVFYISIYDADATTLADVSILSNAAGDGYGIDQVTVGRVPEPGTLALLGLGLAGLGIARRRKHS